MLEEKDIQNIGEEVGRVIEQNITPVLDDLRQDLDSVKTDLETVKTDLETVKTDLETIKANMVTKSYLDDKLADLEGGIIIKLRKEDGKVNRLIEILQKKSILTPEDIEELKDFQIFPTAQ